MTAPRQLMRVDAGHGGIHEATPGCCKTHDQTTTVANIRDGFPPRGIYIGRAGHGLDGYFGNPVRLTPDRTRDSVIEEFRGLFETRMLVDAEYRHRIEQLRGKTLLCFCKPMACHGDVIAEYLNR